jgi:uncharacterized OsmC-like protein
LTTQVAERTTDVREKVDFLTELFTQTPEAAHVYVPAATSIHEGGLAFRTVHPDGSHVETDMPIALGGAEKAPGPEWLLAAALASSYATAIALTAAKLGIELTALEVSVGAESDARGLLGIDDVSAAMTGFNVRVDIGAEDVSDAEVWWLLHCAEVNSPVLSTIKEMTHIEVVNTKGEAR